MLFTFPSRYLCTIGHLGVFSLSGWCRQIQTRFHRPRPTQDTTSSSLFTTTGLSPSAVLLSNSFDFTYLHIAWSYNPDVATTTSVWAVPCSLATTWGITIVFSSYRYLDVSVPCVCLLSDTPCGVGCPIRKSSDLGLLASTRSLSQLATSFFASRCLGILRTPFSFFFLLV